MRDDQSICILSAGSRRRPQGTLIIIAIWQENIKTRKMPGADSIAVQSLGTCIHQIADEQSTVIRNLVQSKQEVLGVFLLVVFLIWKV